MGMAYRHKALQLQGLHDVFFEQFVRMQKALERVSSLNPDAGEIGEGMLRTIVEEAKAALAPAKIT